MHEATLVADLIRKVVAVARDEGGGRVVAVSVRLGALSHLSPEHLREHVAMAAAGTVAEGARLDITCGDDPADAGAQDIVLIAVEIEQ